MTPASRVQVSVGRLVLHGVAAGDRRRVVAAFDSRLGAMLAGAPLAPARPGTPEAIGDHAAERVRASIGELS